MRVFGIGLLLLCLGCACWGQSSDFHHHNVTFGVGPGIPVGSDTSYLGPAPLISVGYGYRFNRLFQADIGMNVAFGAVSSNSVVVTDIGNVYAGNREYMVPMGGRFILPLPFDKFEASVGGGGVYMHYSETGPSSANSYYPINCYTCTSRGGWGGYGLVNLSYFLDSNKNFHVGTTAEFISASLNGQAVGSIPAVKTKDHWTTIAIEVGFSFF